MIRDFLMASVAAIAMTGSAVAADLPSRKAPPVAYVPPPPVFSWTGFYVGVNAGGSFGGSNSIITATPFFAARTFANEAATSALLASSNNLSNNNRVSIVGGGQIGYNWQFSPSFVAGIEADIQGFAGGNRNDNNFTVLPVPGFPETMFSTTNGNNGRNLSYLGAVRGRLGFLPLPNFLLYGTAGLAYGGSHTTTITQFDTTTVPGCFFCAPYSATLGSGGTRVGFAAGAGGEWMFLPIGA